MELTEKPNVFSWMSDKEKALRANVLSKMHQLPDISFFDKDSFKVLGFFSERSTSIVCKVSDSSGVYVAKTSSNFETIRAEAEALKRWKAAGANVVSVIDVITPTDDASIIEILEFIEGGTSVSHLEDKGIDVKELYVKFGSELAKLHTVTAPGFGKLAITPEFRGIQNNFINVLNLEMPDEVVGKLIAENVAKDEDREIIAKAKEILTFDLANGKSGVLSHGDPGLHNTFGLTEIKFFDPTPEILHPMMDLGLSVVWASMLYNNSELAMEGVIEGYKKVSQFDQKSFNAGLYFQIISRYDWWLKRGKFEPAVLNRISQTQLLLQQSRNKLLKA